MLLCGDWLFATIVILSCSTPYSEGIDVGSGDGVDMTTIYNTTTFEINCTSSCGTDSYSLPKIATNFSNSMTTKITIHMNVEHILLDQVKFNYLKEVIIYGNNNKLLCKPHTGIEFRLVETVLIQNLSVLHCGLQMNDQRSGLHIISSSYIMLFNITVAHSNGNGLYIISPRYIVTIEDSNFANSTLSKKDSLYLKGGNGLRLDLGDQDITDPSLVVTLQRCLFAQNTDTGNFYSFYGNLRGRGRGGGLYLKVKNTSQETNTYITDCRFEGNNAYLGAGFSLSLRGDGTVKHKATITDTVVIGNGCGKLSEVGIGGGAFISFENREKFDKTNNEFHFINVTFENNCATLGGGTFFFSAKYNTKTTGRIDFEDCMWTKNMAQIGSALALTPNVFIRAQIGHLPNPVFKNCTFKENTINVDYNYEKHSKHTTHQQYGSGTIYSSLFFITFQETAKFINNFGSGIFIINAEVDFNNSDAMFLNNTAVQGGAISLIGVSTIVIGSNKKYRFENNRAYYRGGALYVQLVDSADIITSRSCFIRISRYPTHSKFWDSSLIFRNNYAQTGGHSIFATSLLPCQLVRDDNQTGYNLLNISEIFTEPGVIIDSKTMENQIATEGIEFRDVPQTLALHPGLQEELNLSILDDLGQRVDMSIVAVLPNDSSLKVTSIFSNGSQYKIKLNGLEEGSDTLTLQTLGTIQMRQRISVTLTRCPPGFTLQNNNSCQCDFDSYIGITRCGTNIAYLLEGFWAGYIENETILATSVCPQGFCQYDNSTVTKREVRLPSRPKELERAICGESRRGILCGTCNEGYTAYYHSPLLSCLKEEPFSCNLGWLFYILSEIIPVTLVFGLVLAFNINLTSGTLNGFILFSQLQRTLYFDASGIITFGPITQQLTLVYQVIYGFFNLDFFNIEPLAYCLWKNATVLDMICFKYLTVIYSFFLVTSVIFFMRYCAARCLGRYYSVSVLRNSIIHGISGFLVLCYTQTITVSFYLLYSYKLSISQKETGQVSGLTRVWFSGDHESFSRSHLPYAVPALLILTTLGSIPPAILLSYPLLYKVLTIVGLNKTWGFRCLENLHTLKPLLDSFQGSFRDQYRFFAGLYFLYRWTGLIIYTYSFSVIGFYVTVQVVVLLMLVLHCLCHPYQKWQHNALDTFVFTIILIANTLSILNYFSARVDTGRRNRHIIIISAFQLFFIYIPIFYIIACIMIWTFRKLLLPKNKVQPSGPEEFVLTKIRQKISSFSSSGSKNLEESELPYRLLERSDRSFTDSIIHTENEFDTY